ncbi:MAG: hypothetical protein VB127_08050 [Sphaerochaeta sp.]|nr:hypothetical protein [Sphaerochaeta sp.]
MKHHRVGRSLLLIILCVSLLASCTSFSDLVRAQVEGLPSWVYSPQSRSGQVSFVGKGSAPLAYNARLLAYEDILAQISSYVGEDVRATYYRELTTTNAIADFGLTISNEHERGEQRSYQVFLLARLNETLLVNRRSIVAEQILKRDAAIEALVRRADQAYRANDDTQAIRLYLEAALLSTEGPVNVRKHETAELVLKAQTFIEALRFSFRNEQPDAATVDVYLRRKSRLLAPKVLNARVDASFEARNSLGRNYTDFLQFNTSTNGFFPFVPYNQGLLKEGQVTFRVDFSDLVPRLSSSLAPEFLNPILSAMERATISFPYVLKMRSFGQLIPSSIQEYSIEGVLLPGSRALSSFALELGLDGVATEKLALSSADLEEQVGEIRSRLPKATQAILGTVGVATQEKVRAKWVVVVSGQVVLYDLNPLKVVYDSQEIEAVASGATFEEARDEAFRRFGSIAKYLVGAYMFRN